MKILLLLVVFCLQTLATYVIAEESCPNFTHKQNNLLYDAYHHGKKKDLGWTLAAITWQESFVNKYIVKMNTTNGNNSFGVTHIEFNTAKWLLKIDNDWEVKQDVVPRLITDNHFAWDLALMKLHTLRKHPWVRQIQLYNGINSDYSILVTQKVRVLRKCFTFELDYDDCYKPKTKDKVWQLDVWSPKERSVINVRV